MISLITLINRLKIKMKVISNKLDNRVRAESSEFSDDNSTGKLNLKKSKNMSESKLDLTSGSLNIPNEFIIR